MQDTARHWYGFGLSLLTAFMWGVLPVFIKLCLEAMDAPTITWYRFAFAGLFVFTFLAKKRALPVMRSFASNRGVLLFIATALLLFNYVANVKGLEYLDPQTTQVVMQLAPFLLLIGAVFFFGERLKTIEKFGAGLLFFGLLLFFNDRLNSLFSSLNNFNIGILYVLFAATTWAAYALMQKPLLRGLTARQLTMMIYLLGVVLLFPFVELSQLMQMSTLQLAALIFCCINTIIGYGAFTEALGVWQAAKVSAVIALAPVFTFISMWVALWWWPTHFTLSELDVWAYLGALVVVTGSMLTSLGRAAK
ncbi:MAG: drug/metabolite transporter (DMT)-like permease [Paraglaciecola sp.]